MVHYVKTRKKLPTGDVVRCEVCRNGGTVYHRTTVARFEEMVKDTLLNPLVCEAQVISFSRKRDQSLGGKVLLVFPEKALPGKQEMCYVHPDDYEKMRRAQRILQEAATRHEMGNIPSTKLHAYLGATRFGYRRECEVMAHGCLPLQKMLKVEYWLSTDCNANSPLLEVGDIDGGHTRVLGEVTKVRELATYLKKPFEVKSCHPAIKWLDNGTWVWATLNHRNLALIADGGWPESEGVSGLFGAVRWNRTKPVLRCKCRLPPPSPYGVKDTVFGN